MANDFDIGTTLTEIRQFERKIIMLEMENEDLVKKNLEDIKELKTTIELKKINIKDYMIEKKLEKYDNLVGYASFQKQQDKHNYDIPKLLEWAHRTDDRKEKYIRIIEEFRKQELKDDVKEGKLDIEEVDGYSIETQPDKFVVKIKNM
jgi:hypothetical protein